MLDYILQFTKKHLIWILLILSCLLTILYIYIYMEFKPQKDHFLTPMLNALLAVIGALVSGGIFAGVLKSLQFNNVFGEELEKIVYSKKFMGTIKDIESIWLKVTDGLYPGSKMTFIRKKIHEGILEHYLPHNADFYYDKCDHHYTLEWIDKKNQEVSVKFINEMVIIADTTDEIILSPKNTQLDEDNTQTIPYVSQFYLVEGKGKSRKKTLIPPEAPDTENRKRIAKLQNETEYTHNILLKGKKTYRVVRETEYSQFLNKDRVAMFASLKPMMNLKVTVTKPTDLECDFHNCGTIDQFDPSTVHSKNTISMVYEDVIYPGQGYMLILG